MAVRKRPRKTPNGKLDVYFATPQKAQKLEAIRDLSLLPYTSRFAPQTDSDILDSNLKSAVLRFLRAFGKDESSALALLILGPTGSGKTSSIRCVARALDRTIVEVTTTDERSSASLKRLLGEATQTHNVLHTAVLVIEDVDVVAEQDRGFYKAVGDLMESSKVPIVLTAVHLPASLPYKDRVRVYELKQLEERAIEQLKSVTQTVGLNVSAATLQALWRLYKGNLGAVLNSLQLSDLSLMTGLSGDVAALSVASSETVATGQGLWITYNSEQSLSSYLDFLHLNSEKLAADISHLSALDDLLCSYDLFHQYACVDSVSSEVRKLDQMLRVHSAEEVVLERDTEKVEMEFPVLALAEACPYQTRSKARRTT